VGGTLRDVPRRKPARRVDNLESNPVKNLFAHFAADQSGATAIEYGLIAGLIAVVIISAVTTLGTKLSTTFNAVASNLV
jgi:pilus assembly protein Flp/PilA